MLLPPLPSLDSSFIDWDLSLETMASKENRFEESRVFFDWCGLSVEGRRNEGEGVKRGGKCFGRKVGLDGQLSFGYQYKR